MKGIAQTVLLLLGWSTMTRWMLAIGLILTAAGLGALGTTSQAAAPPLFIIMTITGAITAVISPVLMSAIVFRSLSAPRMVWMIRNGRLKLLLGAASVQLALAVFISGVVAVMVAGGSASPPTLPGSSWTFFAAMFAVTYATLTVQFLGHYLASRFAFGGMWLLTWPLWARLIMIPLQNPHLRSMLVIPAGPGAIVTISVLTWLAFALRYLTARHIPVPHWNSIGMGARQRSEATLQDLKPPPQRTYTRRDAIRTVLTGGPRQRRSLIVLGVSLIVILLASIEGRSHLPRGAGYALVGLICMMAGPFAGSFAGVMAQRAKPLWLQSGLGRLELFAALEARSWRVVLCASALCAVLAAGWSAVGAGPSPLEPSPLPAWRTGVLMTPLASGALFIYAQLQFVRGRRVVDILMMALAIGLWMSELFSVVVGAETSVVAALLAIQICLVPVLRTVALRRWERIDWLIHKGARNPWGLT